MPSLLVLLVCLCKSFKELFFYSLSRGCPSKADAKVRIIFGPPNIFATFFQQKHVNHFVLDLCQVKERPYTLLYTHARGRESTQLRADAPVLQPGQNVSVKNRGSWTGRGTVFRKKIRQEGQDFAGATRSLVSLVLLLLLLSLFWENRGTWIGDRERGTRTGRGTVFRKKLFFMVFGSL